jgi:hypothetical protein
MTRLLVIVALAVAFGLTIAAPAAFAVPGDPGAGSGQGETKPKPQQGECAGGVPVAEQVCDALMWSPLGEANPVDDTVDAVVGAPGAAARAIGGGVLDEVTRWMTDGARWVTSQIQGLITRTTTPELEARWYRERFAGMAALGGGLSVLVAMIALASAAFRRDPDALGATFIGMFRAGIGTGVAVALVVLALGVADGITNWVAADASGRTASRFWGDVASAWGGADHAGFGSSAIAFLFAVVQVLAGVAVWIELQLRQAGVYVAVLFMPAALAASIWPALRAWQSRLVGLLFVLIAMKPVIVVVLSLAGSAAAAGGDADKDLGLLIAAVMILVLAAFVPWVLMLLVSMDSEGAWTARTATEGMKSSVGGAAGRVGGVATSLGRSHGAGGSPRGEGLARSGGLGGGGGGAAGSSGPGGGSSAGGGSSPGGSGPRAGGPAPAGTVAAAAGLVPPGAGKRRTGGGASQSSPGASSGTPAQQGPNGPGAGSGAGPASAKGAASPVLPSKPGVAASRRRPSAPGGPSPVSG